MYDCILKSFQQLHKSWQSVQITFTVHSTRLFPYFKSLGILSDRVTNTIFTQHKIAYQGFKWWQNYKIKLMGATICCYKSLRQIDSIVLLNCWSWFAVKWKDKLEDFSTRPDFVKFSVLGTLSTPTSTLSGTLVMVSMHVTCQEIGCVVQKTSTQ